MTKARIEEVNFSQLVRWNEKQKLADRAVRSFRYVLYGGAMGGGKSYWIRWTLLKLLLYFHAKYGLKGVVVGLFCEDYPTLKDRQLSKIASEFPAWLGSRHADHKDHGNCFILAPEYGGGVLAFRNLDDTGKYQSAEFAGIGVDELTKNAKETFDDLRNRLRWPGIPAYQLKFIAGTNPGGIGHAWVKKYWMDRDFPPEEAEPELFTYIQAFAKDNPHLDPGYLRQLESLPEDKRRAYLEGDWDIFKGQYFTEWRREIHTCTPFELPRNWDRFVSIDYGYAKPSSVHWWAVDHDGNLYAYREIYETLLTFKALARKILEATPLDEDVRYWVADPAIWAKGSEREGEPIKISGAELMFEVAAEMTRSINLVPGNNDRITGWNAMRQYLMPFAQDGRLRSALTYFTTCKEAIRTIPALVYDEIRTEDLNSDGEDHAADESRYAIMSRPPRPDRPRTPKTRNEELWDRIERDMRGSAEPEAETAWG